MTLIATVATPLFVMQAGDRLLTRKIARDQYETYDANSNKSVIYEASDGLVTISYAGIAFIKGQPTDEWLAHSLHPSVGSMFDDSPDPSAIGTGGNAYVEILSVSDVIKRLRTLLRNLDAKTVSHHGLVVTVAGWRHNETQPLLIEIRRFKASARMQVDGYRRKAGMKTNSVTSLVGSGHTDRVKVRLSDAWNEIHRNSLGKPCEDLNAHMAAIRDVLTDVIRYASKTDQTVGSDVHIASLRRPQADRIVAETHFASATRHPAYINLPPINGVERIVTVDDAAVTGWVLTHGSTTAPSYLVGAWNINSAFASITMNGEQRQGNVGGFFQSIKRRRD